jgi:diguanylate cyclase (GGDEF)-like protein/PAS domain S-box-containing protein
VINQGSEEVQVIRNLQRTQYAHTDPNVMTYKLKTYVGKAVKFGDTYVGSLCAVFHDDFIPSEDDKRLMGLIASAIAVEEARKQDQEALEKSESQYHATIDSMADAIHVVDTDLRFILFNEAFKKWNQELKLDVNVLGKQLFEAFPFLPEKVRDEYREVIESGKILVTEESTKVGDRVFITETRKIPIFEQGKVARIVTAVRDITDKKRVLEALQDGERFLVNIFSSIQDGISILDRDMTILRVNPMMGRWYQHAMPLVGKKCYEAYHGRSAACEVCPSRRTLETGESSYEVVPKRGPQGAIVGWLELYSFPFFDTETRQMKGVIEYVRDITERAKAEEALRYRIEFERLITALSTKFINLAPEEVDAGINDALQAIGKFAGVDRSYVFQVYDNETRASNTHEWCAEGIEPLIHTLKELSVDSAPWIAEGLKRREVIHIPRVEDLPPEAKVEKELFRTQRVKSLVIVPMIYGKSILGFLGFDSVREEKVWTKETISLLKIVGEILANALVHKEAEETIAYVAEQWEMTFDSIADLVSIQDIDSKLVRVNKAFADAFKAKPEELVGKTCCELLHGKKGQIPNCPMQHTLKTRQTASEEIFEPTLGIYLEISTSPIVNEKGEVVGSVHIAKDISERKKAAQEREKLNQELLKSNKRLKQLALRDAHTGLYNYRYLSEVIEAEFYRARRYVHPFSVIMLDIDYFKSVNEVYGHKFGDLVLQQLARQLKNMVRQYDIVIRYGGEEFVIVSPGIDRSKALVLANRILDAIGLYNFGTKKHTIRLKLSLAVSSYPDDRVLKGMELIKLAEQILGRAKESGGDRVHSSVDIGKGRPSLTEKREESGDAKVLRQRLEHLTKRANQSLVEAVFAFAKTIKLKDHYTGEHVEKTVHYATEIAKLLGLPNDEVERIRQAAMLHDLGKIGVKEKILHKRSKLSKKEYQEITQHPQIGVDIIRPIHFLHDIIPLILYHHERWDGKGYPHGLKREEIPIGARVIAIADVYQALISHRAYRKAYTRIQAVKIIKNGSGTQFDPKIVNAFLKVLQKEKK